jgi:hypothetical protein
MDNKNVVYTSLSISDNRKEKFLICARKLNISRTLLLSLLCFKVSSLPDKKARFLSSVSYQKRGGSYSNWPIFFFPADHEFIHAFRRGSKLSASRLIAEAIDRYIDDIMKNGVNQLELAQLRIIQNSYKKKTYHYGKLTLKSVKDDQFSEYIMQIRIDRM